MSAAARREPRVLIVVEQLRRPVPGGIGTYVRGLLAGLGTLEEAAVRSGRRPPFSVLLHASQRDPDPLGELGRLVVTSRLPSWVLTRAWDVGVLRAPMGCDVIHGTSLATPARPRGKRCPLVVMVHDLAWRSHPEATTRRGAHWHGAALRRALRRADAFVVPSQSVATALVAGGAHSKDVTVIAEGANHLPPPNEAGARAVLEASGVSGPYLLAVSTLEPRKNLVRLLEAYRAARSEMAEPIPLVVAGPLGWGDSGLEGDLEGVVAVGHVEGATLWGLYAGATALIYVPLTEGFGLPPLEAMMQGTSVVASVSVPSVAESEEPGALLVDPLDVDAIAQALLEVTSDSDRVRALRAQGSVLAASRTWEAAAAAHLWLWQQVS